jgi:hypothetical protein
MKAAFEHQARHFLSDPGWLIPNIILPFVITLVALMLCGSNDALWSRTPCWAEA